MSRLMWKDMTGPVLLEEFAGLPGPTPRPQLPTDVTEAVTVTAERPRQFLEGLSAGAEHTSRFLQGKEGFIGEAERFGKKRGLTDLDNFGPVTKGLGSASAGLSIAGEALGAVADYKNGVPLKDVVPGAVMHGGGAAAAGLLGGAILSPLGPLGTAAGGIIGSYLADKYLPERRILGERFNKAMEESAERPYYHGPS